MGEGAERGRSWHQSLTHQLFYVRVLSLALANFHKTLGIFNGRIPLGTRLVKFFLT
jgi:hypothetical protein